MSNQENKFVFKVPKVLRNKVNKYFDFQAFVFNDENIDSIIEYYHTFEPVLDEKTIYEKFVPVCSGGNLKTFQFLHSLLNEPDVYSRRIMIRVFESICENGHLNLAEWFVTRYELNYTPVETDEIYTIVCKNGHMELAGFLYILFHFDKEYSAKYMRYFKVICVNGHLDMAKWFVEILHYTGFKESGTFKAVCKRGHLEIAEWLKSAFEIEKTDIKDSLADIFGAVCNNGHMSMLEWLTETFEITNEDTGNLIDIFVSTCSLGRTNIAKYLNVNFRIHIDWKSSIPGNLFENVCKKGYLEMAKFVKHKFNIVESRIRLLYTFETVCRNGFFDMAIWLEEQFKISSSKKRPSYYFTFASICDHNDLKFTEWFFEKFEDNPVNTSDYSPLFSVICKKGYFEMAKWLYNRVKIDSENFDLVDTFEVLCEKGLIEMARWFALKFNMNPSQLRKNLYISTLIFKNKLKFCKWLLSEPKFTEAQLEDISKKEYKRLGLLDEYNLTTTEKSDLFIYAFEKRDAILATFSIKELKLTPQNTLFSVQELLITQLKNENLKGAKFLLEEFGFNRANFLQYFKNAMIECCKYGGNKILAWLVDNLELTKEDLMFDNNVLINTAIQYWQTVIVSYLNQLGIERSS